MKTETARTARSIAQRWQAELLNGLRLRARVEWQSARTLRISELVQDLPPLSVGVLPVTAPAPVNSQMGEKPFTTSAAMATTASGWRAASRPANPLPPTPLLILPTPLVLALLDRRLGGAGEWPRYARTLSVLEEKAFQPLAMRLMSSLSQTGLAPSVQTEGVQSPAAESLGSSTPAAGRPTLVAARAYLTPWSLRSIGVLSFEWSWQGRSMPVFCLVEPFQIEDVSEAAPVPVTVQLATLSLTLGDLLGLERGDVICLPRSLQDPVTVCVQGTPRWWAMAGQREGRLAVQLLKEWNAQEDEQDEPPAAVSSGD
ncbi:MAG: FliM/FliN family flagellar motor switch protein [Limnochordaceae bacterium]|nr:FliM/FliN family flagellar motor switch protein [Limnochordaceae bacterium]